VIDVAAGVRVVGSRLQKKKEKLARMTRRSGGTAVALASSTNLVTSVVTFTLLK
jgi:hypothetical protein